MICTTLLHSETFRRILTQQVGRAKSCNVTSRCSNMNELWERDASSVIFSPHTPSTNRRNTTPMAWIKTVSLADADEKLKKAIEDERALYPKEYADPVHPDPSGASSIVGSHTLIPAARSEERRVGKEGRSRW